MTVYHQWITVRFVVVDKIRTDLYTIVTDTYSARRAYQLAHFVLAPSAERAGLRRFHSVVGFAASFVVVEGVPVVRLSELNLFNPMLDYKAFMIPALIVMLLTILCGFLPALNIVGEKEAGTIEQLNVTPLGKWTFIFGKLIPYWVVGLVAFTLCLILARFVYGLVSAGSLLLLYGFAFLYILIMSGVGIVVSNYSATMQQAMFVTFFFMLLFILMSGLFTSVGSMPLWAQNITLLNPIRYIVEVIRAIYLKGAVFSDMLPQFLSICAFSVILNIYAIVSFKRSTH